MPEATLRRSPLANVMVPGVFGAGDGLAATITERLDLAIMEVTLLEPPSARAEMAFADATGVALPMVSNTSAITNGLTLLSTAPHRWIVVGLDGLDSITPDNLGRRLSPAYVVTDLSHSRCVLRLEGSAARDILAKGLPIDLHERAFPPGTCVQSHVFEIGVLAHLVDAVPRFDLYIHRSYAISFWDWLIVTSAQFGYRIARS